jgi:hypothetical protein
LISINYAALQRGNVSVELQIPFNLLQQGGALVSSSRAASLKENDGQKAYTLTVKRFTFEYRGSSY